MGRNPLSTDTQVAYFTRVQCTQSGGTASSERMKTNQVNAIARRTVRKVLDTIIEFIDRSKITF